VPPAFGRIQSELLAEPERGLIEIGDGVHDVVEPEHAATLKRQWAIRSRFEVLETLIPF
jgi:hypothetical protein